MCALGIDVRGILGPKYLGVQGMCREIAENAGSLMKHRNIAGKIIGKYWKILEIYKEMPEIR